MKYKKIIKKHLFTNHVDTHCNWLNNLLKYVLFTVC